jgi:di/tricarboxylate transporter
LNPQAIYVTFVILAALALIISERVRPDLMALIVLLALWIGQIVTPAEAISGFSRSAVITIIGLFIISAGLDRTGVTQLISDRLVRLGAGSETRLIFLCLVSAALLSLIMNNIAAGAVILPAAVNASRRSSVPTSKLLIPVSFGTLLGGMATFFTTANIVVNNTLLDAGLHSLSFLDFAKTGGIVCLVGIAFMMLIGRRLLPVRTPARQASLLTKRTSAQQIEAFYQLKERLWEAVVLPTSPLVGKSIRDSEIGATLGVTIIAILHGHEANLKPSPDDMIAANDILLITGREERVLRLKEKLLDIGRGGRDSFQRPGVALVEAIVAPHSSVEGRTLKELNFRKKYGMTAVALWREGRSWRTDVGLFELKFGDSLLMVGPPDKIPELQAEADFMILEGETAPVTPKPTRRWTAILITAFVLGLSIFGDSAIIPVAMLLGAVLMVLANCLTMDDGYRAVEWKAVFLIAGMLPISTAMIKTGLALFLGQGLTNLLGPVGPLAVLAGIYIMTVLFVQVMSGQVAAVVIAPIAISAAQQIGISPQAAALVVAIGCSTAFLTPIAHPVNVLMIGPGGYKFSDFFRVGWALTLVCLVALLITLPLFWRV